jgi:cytochrome c2
MIHRTPITKLLASIAIFSLLLVSDIAKAQGDPGKGKDLFMNKCAACHNPSMKKDATGPALAGVQERWGDEKRLHAWIRNNAALRASGDAYANDLFKKWNGVVMSNFTDITDGEINDILAFVKAQADKKDETPKGTVAAEQPATDNSLLYGLITLVLAVIAFVLMQVNSSLRKLTDSKEGIRSPEPVPFWRNKAYISIVLIAVAIGAGVWVSSAAIGLGRQKNYKPVQPIYYSHKVHAGINQINCLYCHGGAEQGKHANIPSVNVCMNCHMGINEYVKSGPIISDDGREINGTEEIKKLYSYAGFDPAVSKTWDPKKGKPIPWIRIHNLPDHVYFNHSQHVKVGKVQCQTCHGPITEMNEVYQFSELSMGWCINCHRETKVQFNNDSTGNKFYSLYEKFHNDLKSGKMDSVTVEKIGGTECQKCHY